MAAGVFIYYIQEYVIMPFASGPGSYIVIKTSKLEKPYIPYIGVFKFYID